jgi:hypothetical protein
MALLQVLTLPDVSRLIEPQIQTAAIQTADGGLVVQHGLCHLFRIAILCGNQRRHKRQRPGSRSAPP